MIISKAPSAWPSLDLHASELDRQQAVALMNQAHELCPYSRATRGNVDVVLTVGGVSIESAAAYAATGPDTSAWDVARV